MTVARAPLIGVGIAAVVLLGVMVPAILKVMIAILWGIVSLIPTLFVPGRAIAFVLPSGPFPKRPEDEHASADKAKVGGKRERPEPARAGAIPRNLSEATRRHTLSMVHSSIGCRRC